jgi:hypothetical protein
MFCLASESDSNVTGLLFRVRVHVLFLMCDVYTCVWLAFAYTNNHTYRCMYFRSLACTDVRDALCIHVCMCMLRVMCYVLCVVWCLVLFLCMRIRLSVSVYQGTSVARQGALSESSGACRNRFRDARGLRTQKSCPNTNSCPKSYTLIASCLPAPPSVHTALPAQLDSRMRILTTI